MAEMVQATPEGLRGFAKKCDTCTNDADIAISCAITTVDSVAAAWGGEFARRFGQSWPDWQQDMKEFIAEVQKTSSEMSRLAAIYQKMDEEARAATEGVEGPDEQNMTAAGVDA